MEPYQGRIAYLGLPLHAGEERYPLGHALHPGIIGFLPPYQCEGRGDGARGNDAGRLHYSGPRP